MVRRGRTRSVVVSAGVSAARAGRALLRRRRLAVVMAAAAVVGVHDKVPLIEIPMAERMVCKRAAFPLARQDTDVYTHERERIGTRQSYIVSTITWRYGCCCCCCCRCWCCCDSGLAPPLNCL